MNVKKVQYVISIIFMIASILLLVLAVVLASRFTYIKENMTPIDSTISFVSHNGDDSIVIIEYTFEGTTYQAQHNSYSSTMRAGDTIAIYVDPENPAKYYQPSIFTYVILPAFFGLICGAVSFPSFIYLRKTATLKKRLLSEGRKVIGTIIDFQTNFSQSMTINRHRYFKSQITCKVVDEFSDLETIYKSHRFWDYVDPLIELGVSTVEIWVDPKNPQIYYVDQESIQERPSNP